MSTSYTPPMVSSSGRGHRLVETTLMLALTTVLVMAVGAWFTSQGFISSDGTPSVGFVNAAAAHAGLPVIANTCNTGTTPFDYVACVLNPR